MLRACADLGLCSTTLKPNGAISDTGFVVLNVKDSRDNGMQIVTAKKELMKTNYCSI